MPGAFYPGDQGIWTSRALKTNSIAQSPTSCALLAGSGGWDKLDNWMHLTICVVAKLYCISICTCTIWIMYRHSAIISSEFFTLLDFNGYFGTPKCGCRVRFFPSFVQVWTCGYEHEQSTRGTGRDVYDAHCVANSYLNWNRSTVYIYILTIYINNITFYKYIHIT